MFELLQSEECALGYVVAHRRSWLLIDWLTDCLNTVPQLYRRRRHLDGTELTHLSESTVQVPPHLPTIYLPDWLLLDSCMIIIIIDCCVRVWCDLWPEHSPPTRHACRSLTSPPSPPSTHYKVCSVTNAFNATSEIQKILFNKIHVQTNTESVQCLPVKYHKSNESWCLDIKTGLHSNFILTRYMFKRTQSLSNAYL